jgi:hypothetical protein
MSHAADAAQCPVDDLDECTLADMAPQSGVGGWALASSKVPPARSIPMLAIA